MQNALPADIDLIPIATIAENVKRTAQSVKRAFRKAGVPIVHPTPKQPCVLRSDYHRHLAGRSPS